MINLLFKLFEKDKYVCKECGFVGTERDYYTRAYTEVFNMGSYEETSFVCPECMSKDEIMDYDEAIEEMIKGNVEGSGDE